MHTNSTLFCGYLTDNLEINHDFKVKPWQLFDAQTCIVVWYLPIISDQCKIEEITNSVPDDICISKSMHRVKITITDHRFNRWT